MAGHGLKRWSRGAIVALAALAALAGCSTDADTLDRSATERTIAGVAEGELDRPVIEVTCPDPIPRGEGLSVRCAATLVGVAGSVRLDVVQTAGDDLDVTVLDAILDPTEVATELEKQLIATYLRPFTAECGESAVRVAAPDSTMSCTVADEAGSRRATATVVDAAGTLEFSVDDPAPTTDPTPTVEPTPTTAGG